MRREWIVVLVLGAFSLTACGGRQEGDAKGTAEDALPTMTQAEEQVALHKENPVGSYGRGLQEAPLVGIAELVTDGPSHLGKLVRVEGTVEEVCPMRGCWMDMTDESGNTVKIKVVDGQIVFPVSAKGHPAVVEGKLTMFELQGEDAIGYLAHLAEEQGEEFDPATVGSEPLVVWQIEGTGAVVSE